jgi:hypothetical protein
LDLHIATTDTPAIRLEQTASIWPAQTWDVAGNEASFFVRDVTGGSRLPFRIRPGAPTSSIDIAASGNVGIGTGSPTSAVHVSKSGALGIKLQDISGAGSRGGFFGGGWGANGAHVDSLEPGGWVYLGTGSAGAGQVVAYTGGSERLRVDATGNVGIGTTAPTTRFHTTGGVRFAGIAGCGGGIQSDGSGNLACLVSSRQYKTITGHLSPAMALANVMALRPQVGTYIATPDQPEHWLIAEEVAAVDPALAGFKDGKPYTVKTQNVVADLVAVIQQQQRRIEVLEKALSR